MRRRVMFGGTLASLATAFAASVVLVGSGVAAATQAPDNTSPPTISGKAQAGETLTANTGSWSGATPMQFSYRWRKCNRNGAECANIGGMRGSRHTYDVRDGDVGHTLRVAVTATNNAGASTAVSAPTAVVTPAGQQPPSGACEGIGSVSLPERLIVDRIQYSPSRITEVGQTFTARFHVSTTRGACVRGALVYAVGVPFNRISRGQEVTTDNDGFAQVEFRVLETLNFRTTSLIVIFVRARKPGDSLLAGVSTRRLVSIPTA